MQEYLELFITFAKIGVMTFGGGYAMLPILEREVCQNKNWAKPEELMDYYAIGQCTPGVIAVNTATFIGKKRKGIAGSIAATLGIVFPSLIIITLIAAVVSNFAELAVVQNAFSGIRVCVCVLIFNAVIKLWKAAVIDRPTTAIFLAVFLGSVFLDLSPVVYVILSVCAGLFLRLKTLESGKGGAEK